MEKVLKSEHAVKLMVSNVNCSRSHGHNHRQFQSFCRKLMLNVGTSCNIQMSDDREVGHCRNFFSFEARNRNVLNLLMKGVFGILHCRAISATT